MSNGTNVIIKGELAQDLGWCQVKLGKLIVMSEKGELGHWGEDLERQEQQRLQALQNEVKAFLAWVDENDLLDEG